MQIGCHGLVWTGTYDAAGIRHAVQKSKEAGFDLIEFPLMDPFTFDVAAARAALDEFGITATGSLGLDEGTDVSSEDESAVRAVVQSRPPWPSIHSTCSASRNRVATEGVL